MKKITITLGLICMAAPAIAAPIINAPADVAAIQALEQQNAVQLDPAALAATYAPNVTVLDYMKGGIYHGRAQFQTSAAAVLAPLKTVSANLQEQNIVTDGSFACDMFTAAFQFTTKSGAAGSISLRQFDAFKKIDGKWQVVQEHIAALKDAKTDAPILANLPISGSIAWPAEIAQYQTVPVSQAQQEILTWSNVSFRVVGIKAIIPYYGPGNDEYAAYAPTAPGQIRGLKGLYDYYAPSMNYFKSLDLHTAILDVASDGILGSELSVQVITLHLWNGQTRPLYWRQSDCVHRVGGKWYGLLTLASFPLDLKTGKMYTGGVNFLVPANTKPAATAP